MPCICQLPSLRRNTLKRLCLLHEHLHFRRKRDAQDLGFCDVYGGASLTKAELRVAAMRELGVSKYSFDFAWIDAIETTGRHDWYEPLRKPPRTQN